MLKALLIIFFCIFFSACRPDSKNTAAQENPPLQFTQCGIAGIKENPSLEFTQYDIASGLSYSYGFSVNDYDNNGKQDISFFDSWVNTRSILRAQPGAIGYIMWDSGEKEIIVDADLFEFSASPTQRVYLFERHLPLDINADGFTDIVGVVNSHDAVIAYLNPGTRGARWQRRVLTNNTPGAVNLDSADIDGDGDVDLFVVMRHQPTASYPETRQGIIWLENPDDQNLEWLYHEIDTSNFFRDTRTVQAGDIDLNGTIDVLVSDSITGRLAWYSNQKTAWERHEIKGLDMRMAHFGKLFDLDGDGLLDIITPHKNGVSWLKNRAEGQNWDIYSIANFTPGWSRYITEVAVGDLDSDGDNDVIFSHGTFKSGNNNPGGVSWAAQNGTDWEVYALHSDPVNRLVGVQLTDFDNDGYLDVLSNTEYNKNGVTLWLNSSNR